MRRKAVIPASIRLQVIARDNGRCRACGIGDGDALQCDHILPESKGGKTTLANLQTLCGVCNNRKGNTDTGELPIRERVNGFGDYDTVMMDRENFLRRLSEIRAAEVLAARAAVARWRSEGVKGYVIRRRLGNMVGMRKVDSILRN